VFLGAEQYAQSEIGPPGVVPDGPIWILIRS